MKYMGSKNRIAKYILPIMERYRDGRVWVEPFVGGGNMIDKVEGERVGFDANPDTIAALITIRDHVKDIPKDNTEFTEADYLNRAARFASIKGFASIAYSFSGKHWGGWSRCGRGDDYVAQGFRNALRQSPNLQGVVFEHRAYDDIELSESCLIYCDPPYAGTTKYKGGFDHAKFWSWCQDRADEGHTVFVSEYSAPSFARTVWEKPLTSAIRRKDGKQAPTEKLYMVDSTYVQEAIKHAPEKPPKIAQNPRKYPKTPENIPKVII